LPQIKQNELRLTYNESMRDYRIRIKADPEKYAKIFKRPRAERHRRQKAGLPTKRRLKEETRGKGASGSGSSGSSDLEAAVDTRVRKRSNNAAAISSSSSSSSSSNVEGNECTDVLQRTG
jgi:hypothetical protein